MRRTSFENILLSSFIPSESPASFPPSLLFSLPTFSFCGFSFPSLPCSPFLFVHSLASTLIDYIYFTFFDYSSPFVFFVLCLSCFLFFSSTNSLDFQHLTVHLLVSVLSGCHPGLTEVFIETGNLSSLSLFFPLRKHCFCNLVHTGLWVLTVIWWYTFTLFSAT